MTKKRPERIAYYDAVRNWRKIARHGDNVVLNRVLVTDFGKYTYGRWRKPFAQGQFPRDFEGACWDDGHKGRKPKFWRYVKHAACHWLVNFNLMLATLVEPKRKWRILTSDKHSTVWDGEETLFDLNFLALQIPPEQCFEMAFDEELSPGEFLLVGYPEHWKAEQRRRQAELSRRSGRRRSNIGRRERHSNKTRKVRPGRSTQRPSAAPGRSLTRRGRNGR